MLKFNNVFSCLFSSLFNDSFIQVVFYCVTDHKALQSVQSPDIEPLIM